MKPKHSKELHEETTMMMQTKTFCIKCKKDEQWIYVCIMNESAPFLLRPVHSWSFTMTVYMTLVCTCLSHLNVVSCRTFLWLYYCCNHLFFCLTFFMSIFSVVFLVSKARCMISGFEPRQLWIRGTVKDEITKLMFHFHTFLKKVCSMSHDLLI